MNRPFEVVDAEEGHKASKALELIQAGVLPELLPVEELVSLTDTLTYLVWEKEDDRQETD